MPLVELGAPAHEVADMIGQRRAAPVDSRSGQTSALSFAPLAEAMQHRRSVREFVDRPIDATALRTALHDGFRAEAALWTPRVHGHVEFVPLVAAFAVDGMPDGLHTVPPPDSHHLPAYLGRPEWLTELHAEYAAAPAIVMICGDASAIEHGQGTGYGSLLMRAAGIGYAAWLSAINAGLAGAVFGGARYPVTTTVQQLDSGLRQLFTLVIGHEHEQA